MREQKNFGLARSSKDRLLHHISTKITVTNRLGQWYTVLVKFTPRFAEVVGKRLPYGLDGDRFVAYIELEEGCLGWDVIAQYANQECARLLWFTETLPEWAEQKRKLNGNKESTS